MVRLILSLIIGLAVLLLGRRLFWLFVGAVGFLAGAELATRFFPNQPVLIIILIALVLGIVGALLAVFLQRVAVGIAGFVAGAFVTAGLLNAFAVSLGRFEWVILLIGAIIAAVIVMIFFDWALVFLSALTGAAIIIQPLAIDRPLLGLVFVGLFILGFAVQAADLMRQEPPPAEPAEVE